MALSSPLPPFERLLRETLINSGIDDVDVAKIARKSMELRMSLYNKVFVDLSTEHAKLLIGDVAHQESFDKKFSSGLIYGEVIFASLVHIIQNTHPKKGEVFADLGHGTGKALIAVAAVFGDRLSRIHGIEILEPLYRESVNRIARYRAEIESELFVHHQECSVTAVLGSFLDEVTSSRDELDWTKADIVFVNSTCFDSTMMKNIAEKAERMKSGGRLVTLTYSLPSRDISESAAS
eukprot:gene27239-32908_t